MSEAAGEREVASATVVVEEEEPSASGSQTESNVQGTTPYLGAEVNTHLACWNTLPRVWNTVLNCSRRTL